MFMYIYICTCIGMWIGIYICLHTYIYLCVTSLSLPNPPCPLSLSRFSTQSWHRESIVFICTWIYMYIPIYNTNLFIRRTQSWHRESIGWRRVIGCHKLQIIYRKRAANYGALLRKMTYKDKASYDFTPPCSVFICRWIYMYIHIYNTNLSIRRTQSWHRESGLLSRLLCHRCVANVLQCVADMLQCVAVLWIARFALCSDYSYLDVLYNRFI